MRKVVVVGAGFSGLSAALRLSCSARELDITVFDKKGSLDFLPLLPDVIGRGISADCISSPVSALLRGKKIKFIAEEVVSLDRGLRTLFTPSSSHPYDYLIISSGTQVNFFGNRKIRDSAFTLSGAGSVKEILSALASGNFRNFIVCGGGYTGIEAATCLRAYFLKRHINPKIVIIERSAGILGPLPDWIKEHTLRNLRRMGIDVLTGSTVEDVSGLKVVLSGGLVFDSAMLIWVPGVKGADFVENLETKKNPQGRVVVDKFLRFAPDSFCAGDASCFDCSGTPLRMSMQFSIYQGARAADNLVRSIKGLPLKGFRPVDLGYIIPMANNNSCGPVLGLKLKGLLPTLLHFAMCLYRLPRLKNKFHLASGLLRSIFR